MVSDRKIVVMIPDGEQRDNYVRQYFARVEVKTVVMMQSSVPEDGQNNCPKHVELIVIINKPLLLHLFGCIYYYISLYFFETSSTISI